MSDQQRVVDWLDDVLAWLREPMTEMPIDRVMQRLYTAFDINNCSWYHQVGQAVTDVRYGGPNVMEQHAQTLAEFLAGQYRDCHPLTAWYARDPSTTPQSCARVPSALVPRSRRSILMDPLAVLGIEEQLMLYYQRDGASDFFVMARGGRDFDDDDLVVARYVQRSLVTLDRQVRILGGSRAADAGASTLFGLTGRELAVLQLLSDGMSARQAARRLVCSPRTIEKHLQHAYRKLEVSDRVNAIRVARLAGAVVEPIPTSPPGHGH